jgi:hypothetical protein
MRSCPGSRSPNITGSRVRACRRTPGEQAPDLLAQTDVAAAHPGAKQICCSVAATVARANCSCRQVTSRQPNGRFRCRDDGPTGVADPAVGERRRTARAGQHIFNLNYKIRSLWASG